MDQVLVYDGDTAASPIKAWFSHNEAPPGVVTSTKGHGLLVRFATSKTGTKGSGWEAAYRIANWCKPGTYSSTGFEPCSGTACAAGKYGPAGQDTTLRATCDTCDAGRFAAQKGQEACTGCTAGQYADQRAQAACKGCPAGRYGEQRPLLIVGMTMNTTHEDYWAEKCNNGVLDDMCHSKQEAMPWLRMDLAATHKVARVKIWNRKSGGRNRLGWHVLELSDDGAAWTRCFEGTLPATYGPHDEACFGVGRYVRLRKVYKDHEAPQEEFLNLAEVQVFALADAPVATCVACAAGRFADQAGQSVCAACGKGRYGEQEAQASAEDEACIACAAGRYGAQEARTSAGSCIGCAAGWYSGEEARTSVDDCKGCTAGRYAAEAGQAACAACEPGRFTDSQLQATCSGYRCAAGHFGPAGQTREADATCTACAVGQHTPDAGTASCIACAPGRYTDEQAQASCKGGACAAGRYAPAAQASAAAAACTGCAMGQYGEQPGQDAPSSACIACAAGRYTDQQGQTSCKGDACTAGRHGPTKSSSAASAACTACAEGHYANQAGQLRCVGCGAGLYADQAAQTVCKTCAAGQYATASILPVKAMTMSSTYYASSADKCHNDKLDDMCHSQCAEMPWLLIDLGSPQEISLVRIWNRQDGHWARLGAHVIEVGEGAPSGSDKPLSYFGGTPSTDKFPLQECAGDCDNDEDCADAMKCFQRSLSEVIPGCKAGKDTHKGYDFCYVPVTSWAWTPCFAGTLPATYGPHDEKCAGTGRYVRIHMTHKDCLNLAEYAYEPGQTSCTTGTVVEPQSCASLLFAIRTQLTPTTYRLGAGTFTCGVVAQQVFQCAGVPVDDGVVVVIEGAGRDVTTLQVGDFAAGQVGRLLNIRGGSVTISGVSITHGWKKGSGSDQAVASYCVDCAAGKYSGKGSTSCALCPPGQECPAKLKRDSCAGSFEGFCVPCSPGNFVNASGKHTRAQNVPVCKTCDAGKYSIAKDCIECPPGFRCANGTRVACDKRNEYQSDARQDTCKTCDAATSYRKDGSRTGCIAKTVCAAGKYEAAAGTATTDRTCADCASSAGTFKSTAGPGGCKTCDAGKYSITTDCLDCPPGFQCSNGTRSACAKGTFAENTGTVECMDCATHPCPGNVPRKKCGNASEGYCGDCSPGEYLLNRVCYGCAIGHFSDTSNAANCTSSAMVGLACKDEGKVQDTGTAKCVSCNDMEFVALGVNNCVKCPHGREGQVIPGVECTQGLIMVKHDFFVVPGNDTLGPNLVVLRCRDYGVCRTCDARTEVCSASMTVRTACLGNTDGLLCASCAPGFGKVAGKCSGCPSVATQAAFMAVCALAAAALSLVMTKKSLQDELDLDTATVSVLRIWLNFLMMTGFLAGLHLDWGSVLRSMFNIAKVGSGGVPPLISCAGVSFASEMTFSLLLPLVVPCVPAVMLACWAVWRLAHGRKVASAPIWGVPKRHFLVNAMIAVASLLWPALVMQVLRILDCSIDIAGEKYVASAVEVKCFVGAHASLRAAAIFELVVVVPALPGLLYYRLRRFPTGPGTWNRRHLYFLYGGFREGYEHWESIVMARKFLVLAATVFLSSNKFGLQVCAAMWVMSVATVLQLLYKPYQNAVEQALELRSLATITIACMIGQVILLGKEEGLGSGGMAMCRWAVAGLVVGMFCLFIAFFAREVFAQWRRKHPPQASSRAFTAENPMRTGPARATQQHAAAGGKDTAKRDLLNRAHRIYFSDAKARMGNSKSETGKTEAEI
eukprot:g1398.t1